MDISQEVLPYVVYACFVLHNFCETHEERLVGEEISKATTYEKEFQPSTLGNRYSLGNNYEVSGKRTRNIFVKYVD